MIRLKLLGKCRLNESWEYINKTDMIRTLENVFMYA